MLGLLLAVPEELVRLLSRGVHYHLVVPEESLKYFLSLAAGEADRILELRQHVTLAANLDSAMLLMLLMLSMLYVVTSWTQDINLKDVLTSEGHGLKRQSVLSTPSGLELFTVKMRSRQSQDWVGHNVRRE